MKNYKLKADDLKKIVETVNYDDQEPYLFVSIACECLEDMEKIDEEMTKLIGKQSTETGYGFGARDLEYGFESIEELKYAISVVFTTVLPLKRVVSNIDGKGTRTIHLGAELEITRQKKQ